MKIKANIATTPIIDTTTYTRIKDSEGWHGSNSAIGLYGKPLSAAVRGELKKNGIKGVTVVVKTFAGGQELILKFKPTEADFVPFDEYERAKKENVNFYQFMGDTVPYKGKWIRQ